MHLAKRFSVRRLVSIGGGTKMDELAGSEARRLCNDGLLICRHAPPPPLASE